MCELLWESTLIQCCDGLCAKGSTVPDGACQLEGGLPRVMVGSFPGGSFINFFDPCMWGQLEEQPKLGGADAVEMMAGERRGVDGVNRRQPSVWEEGGGGGRALGL